MHKSLSQSNHKWKLTAVKRNKHMISDSNLDKAFRGTVVNRALTSLHGE